jgi:hypothetical protein
LVGWLVVVFVDVIGWLVVVESVWWRIICYGAAINVFSPLPRHGWRAWPTFTDQHMHLALFFLRKDDNSETVTAKPGLYRYERLVLLCVVLENERAEPSASVMRASGAKGREWMMAYAQVSVSSSRQTKKKKGSVI